MTRIVEQPPENNQWYNIAVNSASRHADIYLYGVIGGWNANIQQFLMDVQNAGDVATMTVYLNTVGGSFYDGLPIYNTLKQHKAHITVKVMGYALSMGSVIMLAGDVIEAAENSLIMIHRAQGEFWGSAEDMQRGAEILIKHEQAILPEYMRRMGKTANQVQALLNAETWYTADEAKAAGLVDTITQPITPDLTTATNNAESWAYASQHFRNIPPSFQVLTNQKENTMFPFKMPLAKPVQPTTTVPPVPPTHAGNINMSQADMQNFAVMVAQAVGQVVQNTTVPQSALVTALEEKIAELTKQNAELRVTNVEQAARIKELSTPDPRAMRELELSSMPNTGYVGGKEPNFWG